MKKLIIAAFFCLLAPSAFAGSITIQVVETGQSNATKAFTIPDAQIDRLVAAYQIAANAANNTTATRAQVLLYWAQQMMAGTVQYVQGVETQAATAAASAGVTPINPQ